MELLLLVSFRLGNITDFSSKDAFTTGLKFLMFLSHCFFWPVTCMCLPKQWDNSLWSSCDLDSNFV